MWKTSFLPQSAAAAAASDDESGGLDFAATAASPRLLRGHHPQERPRSAAALSPGAASASGSPAAASRGRQRVVSDGETGLNRTRTTVRTPQTPPQQSDKTLIEGAVDEGEGEQEQEQEQEGEPRAPEAVVVQPAGDSADIEEAVKERAG